MHFNFKKEYSVPSGLGNVKLMLFCHSSIWTGFPKGNDFANILTAYNVLKGIQCMYV